MQEENKFDAKGIPYSDNEKLDPQEGLPTAEMVDKILKQANIPAEQKEIIKSQVLVMIQRRQEYYEGPLPHPQLFREYEDILPGAADRIITMAERQQEHRMQLEKIAISGQVKSNGRGQIFGFVTFIFGLFISIAFAYFGMYTFAGILATSTLATVVGLFLRGSMQIQKDLKEKSKDQ